MRKTFLRLKPAEKIASTGLLVTIFSLIATSISVSIAYLGYSISSAVEERNKHDWSIAQANNLKDFWKEIASVERDIIQHVDLVASDAGKFMVATFKVLDEVGALEAQGRPPKINMNNVKLNSDFSALIAAYASLQSSIEGVAVEYDNSVLIYSSIITALGISGWDKYLGQAEKLKKWKIETMQPYEEAYNLVHMITKTGKTPANFEAEVQKLGYDLGRSLAYLAPPSLKGILELKNENYPQGVTKQ